MERCAALIEKLQEDFNNKATPEQLIATVHILQKELSSKITPSLYKKSSKVAVLLPNSFQPNIFEPNFTADAIFEQEKVTAPIIKVEDSPVVSTEINSEKEILLLTEEDSFIELPIIAQHQKEVIEVNNIVVENTKDLNENFSNTKSELSEKLLDTPLKDLKKGIGLDELFRGDEVMYERSIKTINGFNIYPEAQYWMERELKIKLGWDNNNETVEHFYNLVKRRFSEM
jgi:hypothetical protein